MARHCTFGLLLLVAADLLSPAPGAFSWESSNLFVDAVVRVQAQRDAAAAPALLAPVRRLIQAEVSPLSSMNVPVVRERVIRGTLRSHIKRAQAALAPQSPSEDH